MSYKLSWLVADHVIELEPLQDSNDDAVSEAMDAELNAMLDGVSHPVNILIDLRSMQQMPSASKAMKMNHYKHPNTAQLILIGLNANPMLRFLGGLVGKGIGIQMKDFRTREEALAYITSLERL